MLGRVEVIPSLVFVNKQTSYNEVNAAMINENEGTNEVIGMIS